MLTANERIGIHLYKVEGICHEVECRMMDLNACRNDVEKAREKFRVAFASLKDSNKTADEYKDMLANADKAKTVMDIAVSAERTALIELVLTMNRFNGILVWFFREELNDYRVREDEMSAQRDAEIWGYRPTNHCVLQSVESWRSFHDNYGEWLVDAMERLKESLEFDFTLDYFQYTKCDIDEIHDLYALCAKVRKSLEIDKEPALEAESIC